jgi:hypothetical protein
MVLFIRKLRHKLSYKNRRFGLTSLEKMTIKSVGEHIETLINIFTLTGTSKLDKLIKELSKAYMDMTLLTTRLLVQGLKSTHSTHLNR